MFDFASKRYRKSAILGVMAVNGSFGRATQRKELFAIGKFDKLRQDHPGHAKGGMDIPNRARAAMFGDVKGRGVKSLGNIASLINAQEKERHAASPMPLQGGKPVTDLFKRHQKSRSQPVNIIAAFFGQRDEFFIWHQKSGRKIIGQLYLTACDICC